MHVMRSDFVVGDPTKAPDYTGIAIVQSPHAMTRTQVRFPRSKRKRIRMKWAKQDRNYEMRPGMWWVIDAYRPDGTPKGLQDLDIAILQEWPQWGNDV